MDIIYDDFMDICVIHLILRIGGILRVFKILVAHLKQKVIFNSDIWLLQ